MITRLHGASSTLVANPRRRRRNPARTPALKGRRTMSLASKVKAMHKRVAKKIPEGSHPVAYLFPSVGTRTNKKGVSKKYRTLSASRSVGVTKPKYTIVGSKGSKDLSVIANPRRRKHHNPRAMLPHFRARKPVRRKNPMLEIAGVPVIEMAAGSVGAIAAAAAINGLVDKYKDKLPSAITQYPIVLNAVGPAAVAAVAAFAYKKTSGSAKDVAKYAFIGSVFLVIDELIGGKVKELVGGKTGGIYIDPYSATPAVGGMYMSTSSNSGMGGMYLHANGTAQADMGGLGLYQAKSIYG